MNHRPSDSQRPDPWRSRGYLPHFHQPGLVQQVTFRLADSLPRNLLRAWREELRTVTDSLERELVEKRIALHLDRGLGACHLRDPAIARIVEDAMLHFDAERYRMLAWCVMPNHVHAVVETLPADSLEAILHSWKSFTAKKVNRMLGRAGRFWQREYHDRFVRDQRHLLSSMRYVEWNPVKAGLVSRPEAWRWGSAWHRSHPMDS